MQEQLQGASKLVRVHDTGGSSWKPQGACIARPNAQRQRQRDGFEHLPGGCTSGATKAVPGQRTCLPVSAPVCQVSAPVCQVPEQRDAGRVDAHVDELQGLRGPQAVVQVRLQGQQGAARSRTAAVTQGHEALLAVTAVAGQLRSFCDSWEALASVRSYRGFQQVGA